MKVTHVEQFVLDIPFESKRLERLMHRAGTHEERVQAWRVETDLGILGYGEGPGSKASIARITGHNPFEFLTDDSIGFGIQMALYDIAGKADGVPVYRLLGPKVRDECPISWWAHDMSPEDWEQEVKRASKLGYMSVKLKARPWRDIFAQVEAISQVAPQGFSFGLDFNGYLLNAGNAVPILRELERNEHVQIFETPIPQEDVEGYRQIRRRVAKPIAIHYGVPPIVTALREEVCDGFCLHGDSATPGVMEVTREATIMAAGNKPFWLQMVGTGITTVFMVHLGSVFSHAQWPGITTHELWGDDLLKERLEVRNGYIQVPDRPGLGVEVDETALERYRVDPKALTPRDQYLQARRVVKVKWPAAIGQKEGPARCFASESDSSFFAYQRAFYSGNLPLFVRGASLEVVEDDGSPAFNHLYERVKSGGTGGVWE